MKYLLFIFILFTGCQTTYIRQGIGVGEPLIFHKITAAGSGKPISIIHNEFYFGNELFDISKHFKVDGFIGPAIEIVEGGKEVGIGLDILPRLRYTYLSGIEPYFILAGGFHYFSDNIKEQATPWGFVLGGGFGARAKIIKETWVFIEWRVWHESNGSSIFGSPRPNSGYNTDLILIGIEYKF